MKIATHNRLLVAVASLLFGLAIALISGCEAISNFRTSQVNFDATEGQARNSQIVIPLKFSWADSFSEELAAVKIDGQWGYLDNKGNFAIKPQFDNAESFFQGLAATKLKNKWGYINKSGNLVIKPKYDLAKNFSQGLAAVKIDGKWGYSRLQVYRVH
ncbi:WG repeat-containing protein [Coleofasciculus sp. FACHB-SPT36]|uniref:WG repeat-containing protein n=1 Tax=Cyanophyceae TaxID=3028117 RepID=UPI00168ACCA7|nr:WG repeat-containing protein [Coleofasciculus sp. FACHB-SPT36]MBD2541853.1 WG repeat-containing protein [Coleofasciculus sp. FACHB-SPT36]